MSTFEERRKSLFNHLKDAEDQYSLSHKNKVVQPQADYGTIDRYTYRKLKHEMKQFRGRESIFKRPEANIRECLRAKTIPDHIKNPQKWVYYNLSDVTPEQMSDATNTATALALIKKLEEKAEEHSKIEHDTEDVFKKPTFHFSSSIKKDTEDEKAVFKSGKVIMPEYVVGVTKKKEKKNLPKKEPKASQEPVHKNGLKLDHLYDDEE
ncbi:uncharacterized protein LOC115440029 [Manduca sexta]|uniref:U5 small nuclear ribonucleoprotein TSSC4 n=1 Tax=Manduca sexta TaxID=7130 RepID=A0A921YRZ6_MANSE|nr:uncharacterized protein LOC115440029 [Manduca sexta]KAG6444781.1 hypothetical protein O3G_MSEX003573 [Manduca sexta]